jgi:hypothetical protein
MASCAFRDDPELSALLLSLDSDPAVGEIPMLTALRESRVACVEYGATVFFEDLSLRDSVQRASGKGSQKSICGEIEQRAADVHFPDVADDCGLLDALQQRCRYHNTTGKHVSSKFSTPRAFLPSEYSNAAVKFMMRQHVDLPLALEAHLCDATDGNCPACNMPWQRDHILSCDKCATDKRYAKHQKLQNAFIAIVSSVGLHPWAGKSGGGPCLRDPCAFTRGSGDRNRRTDVEIGGLVGKDGTVHTDFTVVGGSAAVMSANPNAALDKARCGAHDPDFFVKAADATKNATYVDMCRRAMYTFIPFAVSTGGRTSPAGLRLIKHIYAAVEDRVDNWYFYGVLLPRIYVALALGQFEHSLAIRRALEIKRAEKRRGTTRGRWRPADEDCMPPPPCPSQANARYDFVDSVDSDMDGRWGFSEDGSCAYDHERGREYAEFLRTVHPGFFAAAV